MNSETFTTWLLKNEISYDYMFDLSNKSWLKAGGYIEFFLTPKNKKDLIKILKYFNQKNISFYVLGNISNVVIRDGIIKTPIISLRKFNKFIKRETSKGLSIYAGSGTALTRLSINITKKNYSGFEGLVGIPGSLGGGLYMNASSYDSCISNYLHKTIVINKENKIEVLKKDNLKFSFRNSSFQNNRNIIIGAYFFIKKKKKISSLDKLQEIKDHRFKFQENQLPNLGSIFATKDIYSDIKYNSISILIFFILNKILISILSKKIFKKNLLNYKIISSKIFGKLLNLNERKNFFVSQKTINCLINKGSTKADDAIEFLYDLKKKTKSKIKFENIILDKIKLILIL